MIAPCPYCGYTADPAGMSYAEPGTRRRVIPKPGDYMLCYGCVLVLVLDDNLNPVPPVESEIRLLHPHIVHTLLSAQREIIAHKEAARRN